MPILNNVHILCNASLQSRLSQFLEERYKFTKLTNLGELLLEVTPDIMRFPAISLLCGKEDLCAEVSVECLRICDECA